MATQQDMFSSLVHPVYLDVPMLVSFLAALDDGINFQSEVAEKSGSTRRRVSEAGLQARLPSLASLLGLGLSGSGKYSREGSDEESAESKFVREHTASSLFNIFRQRLASATSGILRAVDSNSFEEISPGNLVEVTGEIKGNPLRQVVDLFSALAPLMGIPLEDSTPDEQPSPAVSRRKQGRSGNPAVRSTQPAPPDEEDGLRETAQIMRTLIRDAARSPVIDLLMSTGADLSTVLTVSRAYLSEEAEAYLLGGCFTVLGKVTEVLRSGDGINLLRRTALGFGGEELSGNIFQGLSDLGPGFTLADPKVNSPALQILPLAIYI
jgi:hypothetical protein